MLNLSTILWNILWNILNHAHGFFLLIPNQTVHHLPSSSSSRAVVTVGKIPGGAYMSNVSYQQAQLQASHGSSVQHLATTGTTIIYN